MFLRFLKSLLDWISGIDLAKISLLLLIIGTSSLCWYLGKSLLTADGKVDYCFTKIGSTSNQLTIIPVYFLVGHVSWKQDIVLGQYLSQEEAQQALKTYPNCQK